MAFTYETATPIIPNTTMRKRLRDGVFVQYLITPNEGYVLHDTAYDMPQIDQDTGEEYIILGYRTTEGGVAARYDFATGTMLDEAGNTVTYYGDRQLYTKLATEVPEDQIFGDTNKPEIA